MTNLKAAIVEDNNDDAKNLSEVLNRYFTENKITYKLERFLRGEDFLESSINFDIVFLDIEMQGINGIETASRLREKQKDTVIILVTNMIQYAIQGYSVQAADYILKPVDYEGLSKKIPSFLEAVNKKKKTINVKTNESIIKLLLSKILYIEVFGHRIVIHYGDKTIECGGTLKEFEADLSSAGFVKSSKSCLVNLSAVERIDTDTVTINGEKIPLSRRERKPFIEAFAGFDGR